LRAKGFETRSSHQRIEFVLASLNLGKAEFNTEIFQFNRDSWRLGENRLSSFEDQRICRILEIWGIEKLGKWNGSGNNNMI
jgi:hypothetical protein